MKKILTLLFTVVLVMAFTACGGGKKTETPPPAQEPVKVEPVVTPVVEKPEVPAPPKLSPAEMLKEFQSYAKAYGEAFNNMAKDPKKFTELSRESLKRVADMEKIKDNLNARQKQDYQRSLDIVKKVNSGGK